MPEGPELHLASLYVNEVCDGVVFTGAVRKSEVSKCPDVPFTCEAYRITATSRGKEVKLTLAPIKGADSKQRVKRGQADQPMDVVFHFGMSGYFRFSSEDEVPKHAHLRFYTKEKSCRVLSFVDTRRFGSWQPNGTWQRDRGPCVMFEYSSFRENVVSHLSDRVFDLPVCEVLLNQKYFNGIGNYLRAEILYSISGLLMANGSRLNIPPFVSARNVLEGLEAQDLFEKEKAVKNSKKKSDKVKKEEETDDLLRMCHMVPLEVVNLGGKGYDPAKADYSGFKSWLRCYSVEGMNCLQDHSKRTMWFKGDPGPMVPKGSKSRAKILVKKERGHENADKKKVARNRSESTLKKRAIKQETAEMKEKDARPSEAGSKRRKTGKSVAVTKPRRSSSSGEKAAAGSQRRSRRLAEQNSK